MEYKERERKKARDRGREKESEKKTEKERKRKRNNKFYCVRKTGVIKNEQETYGFEIESESEKKGKQE
jgi:hypothetical protein